MKSHQTKKRLAKEEASRRIHQEARENNPYLMSLYLSFIPMYAGSGTPKFITDKYGNRVLNENYKKANT